MISSSDAIHSSPQNRSSGFLHFLKQRALFDRLRHLENLRKFLPLLLQKHSDRWSIRQSLLQQSATLPRICQDSGAEESGFAGCVASLTGNGSTTMF